MIRRFHVSGHHKELLRTNLWLVPALLVLAAIGLFVVTYSIDLAAYHGDFGLPSWVISGSADAARQILTTIAAAIITVVGVVFSIVIVALTLVSTQFGPRMLRNFIRDRGTQLTLGTFVATFVYAVLALVSIGGPGPHGDVRAAHQHHRDTGAHRGRPGRADLLHPPHRHPDPAASGDRRDRRPTCPRPSRTSMGDGAARPGDPTVAAVLASMPEEGGDVLAADSGYLQYIHRRDAGAASPTEADAVILLRYRPGHFLVQGSPLATVWPASAAPGVARELDPGPRSPARTGRWPRTSRSASTSWWRSPSAPCPPRSTTRSRR